ncbi:MAG: C69 family dipeptidase [Anaerolineales bacterium]|nr:MAG: C69 family dipeptidase [Anaerolineales bacterium]
MCDTLIATRLTTADGVAVFGKNSDRPPNEGQSMVCFPAEKYPAGSKVKCTYIEIPQAEKTHAVLLSKPFWMWGAEMGVNEHGLVIGNEAVYSKIPANKEPALLGMDMLRAALERAITPREAIDVIVALLEEFGQGGNCLSHGNEMYYHNSFLIANAEDAWVLETVDKQWAARQIKDVYTISNCLTIGAQYDLASEGLVDLAIQKGMTKSRSQFKFAHDYSDFLYTNFGRGRIRRETTITTLDAQKGKVGIETMMATLRHHNNENFDPQGGIAEVNVCMHAGFGPIRISQSTASMVTYLDKANPIIFATGTSAPCTSIFKPFWIASRAASFLDDEPVPTSQADSNSLYWTHERLHRATLLNYPERIQTYAADRDALEKEFIEGALKLQSASAREREAFSKQCLAESRAAETEWLKRVEAVPAKRSFLFSMAWDGFDRKAGVAG